MKNIARSQWIAVLTGIVAVALGVAYLLLVQMLDWRGTLQPITEL